MESMWNVPFHVYSIWNPGWGWNEKIAEDSPKNVPYGIHGMDGGIHPFHMDSIWNILGSVKTSSGCAVAGSLCGIDKVFGMMDIVISGCKGGSVM